MSVLPAHGYAAGATRMFPLFMARSGDVSYRWRDRGEAFRDRGPEIAFRDTSDASIAAGLELARAKWGNEVTIHGSADFKERALRLAVERGMHVKQSGAASSAARARRRTGTRASPKSRAIA